MTTYAIKIASSIVTAHLATNKMAADEIPGFLDQIFDKIVSLDSSTMELMPSLAAERTANAKEVSKPSVQGPKTSAFRVDAWLSKIPDPTPFTESEARRNNPYLDKGWVGVHDSHIVCLLDGKSVRVLTSHLKRHYKNDPRAATAEAYRAHFHLPPDYPMSAPDFHALKSRVIAESHAKGRKSRKSRDADTQLRINYAIATAGLNPDNQINADEYPGLFPDAIVCAECSARVGDLAEHLASAHPQLTVAKYLKNLAASSDYPLKPANPMVPEHTFDDTLAVCATLLDANDRSVDRQIDGQVWPGVFERFITCLEDGKEVTNLGQHLKSDHDMSEKEYIARWKLPANYPFMAPGRLPR